MNLIERIDKQLSEQKKMDAKKIYKGWRNQEFQMNKILKDTLLDFKTMDDQVGGTTMIDPIEKKYTVLKKALKDFGNELYSAMPEYDEMFKEKEKR